MRSSSRLKPIAVLVLSAVLSVPIAPAHAASTGGTSSTQDTAVPGYADAQAQVDAGQYKQAIKTLADLVKAEPKNADAWNLLGYSSRKLKQYQNAAKYYDMALKLDPQHKGALEYQGELFVETKDYAKAKDNLKTLAALCGNCEQYVDLRTALAKAGQI